MTAVKSTHLKSVDYNKTDKALTVTFHSGGKYRLKGVSAVAFRGLMRSKSKGRYFNEKMRDRYDATRLRSWKGKK